MKRQWIALQTVLCLLLCALCLPAAGAAGEDGGCALRFTYAPEGSAMAGVEFRLYRVGEVDRESMSFRVLEPYREYRVLESGADWLTRAATLAGYVARDGLTPDRQAVTGAEGEAVLEDLEEGLYLIVGRSELRSGSRYTPVPFLLSLPETVNGRDWSYRLEPQIKYTRTPLGGGGDETVRRRVIVQWVDEGNEEERPEQVTVELLRDGALYDSAVLSAENNWRWDWDGLDAGAQWQLTERLGSEKYTVSITQQGDVFVVTYTYTAEEDLDDGRLPLDERPDPTPTPTPGPTDPPDDGEGGGEEEDLDDGRVPLDRLPQTGQLWWPVPILAVAGMLLILLGLIRHRRGAWDEAE